MREKRGSGWSEGEMREWLERVGNEGIVGARGK